MVTSMRFLRLYPDFCPICRPQGEVRSFLQGGDIRPKVAAQRNCHGEALLQGAREILQGLRENAPGRVLPEVGMYLAMSRVFMAT